MTHAEDRERERVSESAGGAIDGRVHGAWGEEEGVSGWGQELFRPKEILDEQITRVILGLNYYVNDEEIQINCNFFLL